MRPGGRCTCLEVRDVDDVGQAKRARDSLRAAGVSAVIGTYSSTLSLAASSAVAVDGPAYATASIAMVPLPT